MRNLPISLYVITKNEADRLDRMLSPIANYVDEIVVVDSGSVDETCDIAKSYGAKVYFREWSGYADQKKYAESLCANKWLLNLDADEVVNSEFVDELFRIFNNEKKQKYSGYNINIRFVLPFEKNPRRFVKSFNVLRLYDRTKARIPESKKFSIHDRPILETGIAGQISSCIAHYSFRSLSDIERKSFEASNDQARNFRFKNKSIGGIRLVAEFPIQFIKFYLIRRFIFMGWYGVVLSILFAQRQLMRLAKAKEMELMELNLEGESGK